MIDRQRRFYMTNTLWTLLENWKKKLKPSEYNGALTHIAEQINHIQEAMKKIPAGKERAKWANKFLQDVIGKEIKQAGKEFDKVQCRSGCSGCCHQQIEISGDEGALLASLIANGLEVNQEKLERQANTKFDDLAWWRQSKEDKACTFLGDNGKCRIYENRPTACRKYYVFTPPEKCSEVSSEGSITVGVYGIPDAEIIASAIMDGSTGTGPMPQVIWKHLKEHHAIQRKI